MLVLTDPREAYQRCAFDARVKGADASALVGLCLEQAIAALGGALLAQERNEPVRRNRALSRALTALTALDMGVDRAAPLADALLQLYGTGRQAVLDSVIAFRPQALAAARQDLIDIDAALNPRRL